MKPCLALAMLGAVAFPTNATESEPRSAIPWLSDVFANPSQSTSNRSHSDPITVTSLDVGGYGGVGILDQNRSDIAPDIWVNSDFQRIKTLLETTEYSGPPAVRNLFRSLLLTEFTPPQSDDRTSDLFLVRVDKLLEIGAVNQAAALIDAAGSENADLFSRKFDIGLLTNHADHSCDALENSPMLSLAKKVQVFCLVRKGDWDAAAVTLTLGETLGQIDPHYSQLLSFFLDPSLLEEEQPPAARVPMSALEFLIRESVGLPRADAPLPDAFLHADLAKYVPLRFRMAAAERLVHIGVLDPAILFSFYREERPASSGGIWERANAIQQLDRSDSKNFDAVLQKLNTEMSQVGLRHALARELRPRLEKQLPEAQSPRMNNLIAELLLLSDKPRSADEWISSDQPVPVQTAALVAGLRSKIPPTIDAHSFAVLSPFIETNPHRLLDARIATFFAQDQTGEALVEAIKILSQQELPDPGDITLALATLRVLKLEKAAQQIAIQMLLLE